MNRQEIELALAQFPYDYNVWIIDNEHKCVISKHKLYDCFGNEHGVGYSKMILADEWFSVDGD